MNTPRSRPRARGFTLLELVLALTISIGLLVAIVTAIDLQYRVVEAGRIDVEQAQLARTILRRVADDLRSTLVHNPAKTTGLDELLKNAGLATADAESLGALAGEGAAGDGAALEEAAAGAGLDVESEDAAAAAEAAAAELEGQSADTLATNLSPRETPGIYGNSTTLQIDVSRLPRLDQYSQTAVEGERDRTSDVKTVAYFVIPPDDPSGAVNAQQMTSDRPGGLYRREVDRSVGLWSSREGEIATLDDNARPLAPEVVAIQFQYHDGTAWTTAWDSTEKKAPPLAVEVIVTVRSPRRSQGLIAASIGSWGGDDSIVNETQYRQIVHVPGASRAALEEAAAAAEAETGTTGETTGSGATSSGATSNAGGASSGSAGASGSRSSSGAR